jgi:hypothetical protein
MAAVRELAKIKQAEKELKLSREFLYRLPPGTPGVFKFGRSWRCDIDILKQWAAEQARKTR